MSWFHLSQKAREAELVSALEEQSGRNAELSKQVCRCTALKKNDLLDASLPENVK